jgi:hypothetical protein
LIVFHNSYLLLPYKDLEDSPYFQIFWVLFLEVIIVIFARGITYPPISTSKGGVGYRGFEGFSHLNEIILLLRLVITMASESAGDELHLSLIRTGLHRLDNYFGFTFDTNNLTNGVHITPKDLVDVFSNQCGGYLELTHI